MPEIRSLHTKAYARTLPSYKRWEIIKNDGWDWEEKRNMDLLRESAILELSNNPFQVVRSIGEDLERDPVFQDEIADMLSTEGSSELAIAIRGSDVLSRSKRICDALRNEE